MSYYDKHNIPSISKTNEELVRDFKNGDKEARNKLILKNMKFIQYLSSLYKNSWIYYDDLIECGIIGLTKAIERFDESKNILFTSYASFWVNEEINNFLNRESLDVLLPINYYYLLKILKKIEQDYKFKHESNPTNQELLEEYKKLNYKTSISLCQVEALRRWFNNSISLNKIFEIYFSDSGEYTSVKILDNLEDFDANFAENSLDKMVNEKIKLIINGDIPSTLTDNQRLILDYYFGFNNEPINIIQIAKKLNISKQNVSITLRRSLQKIKKILLDNQIISEDEFKKIKDKKISLY